MFAYQEKQISVYDYFHDIKKNKHITRNDLLFMVTHPKGNAYFPVKFCLAKRELQYGLKDQK